MTILIRCIFVDILRIETDSFNILKLNYAFFIERNFGKYMVSLIIMLEYPLQHYYFMHFLIISNKKLYSQYTKGFPFFSHQFIRNMAKNEKFTYIVEENFNSYLMIYIWRNIWKKSPLWLSINCYKYEYILFYSLLHQFAVILILLCCAS